MKNSTQSGFLAKLSTAVSSLSDTFQKISSVNISKKLIITGFTVIILILALFSAAILIDEKADSADITTTDILDIDPAVLGNTDIAPVEGSFVFALTNNEKNKVLSVVKIDFSSEKESFFYEFIPAATQVNINGVASDLSGHLAAGGTNLLLTALRQCTGTDFLRYIVGDETSLLHLFQLLGGITVDIESTVRHDHNGVNYIIETGTQELTPDMLLKYCLYLISDCYGNGEKIIGIIIDCLEALTQNPDDVTLEGNFCTAIGYFDTDISAFDYYNNKELLKSFPQMSLKEKAQPLTE